VNKVDLATKVDALTDEIDFLRALYEAVRISQISQFCCFPFFLVPTGLKQPERDVRSCSSSPSLPLYHTSSLAQAQQWNIWDWE